MKVNGVEVPDSQLEQAIRSGGTVDENATFDLIDSQGVRLRSVPASEAIRMLASDQNTRLDVGEVRQQADYSRDLRQYREAFEDFGPVPAFVMAAGTAAGEAAINQIPGLAQAIGDPYTDGVNEMRRARGLAPLPPIAQVEAQAHPIAYAIGTGAYAAAQAAALAPLGGELAIGAEGALGTLFGSAAETGLGRLAIGAAGRAASAVPESVAQGFMFEGLDAQAHNRSMTLEGVLSHTGMSLLINGGIRTAVAAPSLIRRSVGDGMSDVLTGERAGIAAVEGASDAAATTEAAAAEASLENIPREYIPPSTPGPALNNPLGRAILKIFGSDPAQRERLIALSHGTGGEISGVTRTRVAEEIANGLQDVNDTVMPAISRVRASPSALEASPELAREITRFESLREDVMRFAQGRMVGPDGTGITTFSHETIAKNLEKLTGERLRFVQEYIRSARSLSNHLIGDAGARAGIEATDAMNIADDIQAATNGISDAYNSVSQSIRMNPVHNAAISHEAMNSSVGGTNARYAIGQLFGGVPGKFVVAALGALSRPARALGAVEGVANATKSFSEAYSGGMAHVARSLGASGEVTGAITGLARASRAAMPTAITTTFRSLKAQQDAYDVVTDRIHQLATDPELAMQTLSAHVESMVGIDRTMADAYQAKQMEAVRYLDSLAPQRPIDPYSGRPAEMPKHQMDTYFRQLHLAQNPTDIAGMVANNTVTHDDVTTVATIYPTLMSQMKNDIGRMLAESRTVPYSQRVSISTLFDNQLEMTVAPSFVAIMQRSYASQQQAAQQAQRASAGAGRSARSIGQSFTLSQEIER